MVTYLEDTGLVYVYNGSSWVDINDNSGAIPKSTVTTAGDLIVADGSASVTRLGIGANGTYLTSNGTTASWGTISSGGLTLLSTTDLSGSVSVTISSISQDYKILYVFGENIYSSDFLGDDLQIRVNALDCKVFGVKGGSSSSSLYFSSSSIVSDGMGATSALSTNLYAIIPNYTFANYKTFTMGLTQRGNDDAYHLGIRTANAAAVSSLTFINAGGVNFAGGTVKIYGAN
jgi:hypothetical protein